MIAFGIYLLLFTFLIYRNGFFKLFRDEHISYKQYSFFFLLKALAVPSFYFIYTRFYGGIKQLDAGKFYSDVEVFNQLAYQNFPEFLKALFGLQNEDVGSYAYEHLLLKTQQWDNGLIRSFLFNDNRLLIRLHGVLHFIAFQSYFVHALFCSFYSLIGMHWCYRALKSVFKNYEYLMMACFVGLPSLWLFTGALLKEAVTFLSLSLIIYSWYGLFKPSKRMWVYVLTNGFMLFIALLLKPYLLLPTYFIFGLFFAFRNRLGFAKFCGLFFIILILGTLALNQLLLFKKGKSIISILSLRQSQFVAVAEGGIFLANDSLFLRLAYDTTLMTKHTLKSENTISICQGAAYTYWVNNNTNDTLFCASNKDTVSLFHEAFRISPSKSNLPIPPLNSQLKNLAQHFPVVLYYVAAYPFFFNAKGLLDYVVSFENLVCVLCCLALVICFWKNSQQRIYYLVSFTLCVLLFVLIGYTSPNSGAIIRYRCLVLPFLLISGLQFYAEIFSIKVKPFFREG